MSLPGSASAPAMARADGGKSVDDLKRSQCAQHVKALFAMMRCVRLSLWRMCACAHVRLSLWRHDDAESGEGLYAQD